MKRNQESKIEILEDKTLIDIEIKLRKKLIVILKERILNQETIIKDLEEKNER